MTALESALPLYINMMHNLDRKMSVEELSLMRASMLIPMHVDLKTDVLDFKKIIEGFCAIFFGFVVDKLFDC